jgi:hypothetical protein
LNKNVKFSTKSVYILLEKNVAGATYKWIWSAKIPLKIKIFMWQFFQNACREDNLWGMPRAELSAGWCPRSLHGSRMRRPAPPEGPAVPAAGWRLHRGELEPGDEDKSPPTAVSPKVAWP